MKRSPFFRMGRARRRPAVPTVAFDRPSAPPAIPLRVRLRSSFWTQSGGSSPPILQRRVVYPLVGFIVLAQGLNWPLMAVGLRSISPLWMSAFRLVGATITLFALTASMGRLSRPARQDYPVLFSVGIFMMALTLILIYSALDVVPPGRSAILAWTASLWTVPVAVVFLKERMNPLRWAGLAAGVAGILLVFDPGRLDWGDGRVVLGHAMLLGVAFCNAGASVHIRHHSWKSTILALLPWQTLVATIPVVAAAFAADGLPRVEWSPGLLMIMAYQGVVASGIALWAQFAILRSYPAISTNLALMGVPVVGLLSSALLLHESLGGGVLAGLGLVIAGVTVNRLADGWARGKNGDAGEAIPL